MKTSIRNLQLACLVLAAWLASGQSQAEGLLAMDNPASINEGRGVYAVAEGFQGSDAVSIRQFLADWQGTYTPRSGGNIGVMSARTEAGVQWNGFRLGALHRVQALVTTNRDTTDLVRQYNTNSGYEAGRSYAMDYKLTGFAANGLRLSKSLHFDVSDGWQARWAVAGTVLTGTQFKMETASGKATALTTQDFSADTVLNAKNSALNTSDPPLFNPFVPPQSFSGQGYAMDAGIIMRRSDGLQMEAAVNDLVGQMDWKNIPLRVTNYNTATKYYDAAGYVHFNPSASALSSYVNYTQTLEPTLWLALSYPLDRFDAQMATSYVADLWLPEVNLSFPLSPNWRFKTGYDLRFGTVLVALQHPWFGLSLRTDNPDLAQAKGYGMRLAITFPI